MEVGIPEADPEDKVLGGHNGEGLVSGGEVVENDCRESRGDATDGRSSGAGEVSCGGSAMRMVTEREGW